MNITFASWMFSQRVQAWIGKRGLRAAAEEVGLSAATLSRICRGHHPDVTTFVKLAHAMGATLDEFVHDADYYDDHYV